MEIANNVKKRKRTATLAKMNMTAVLNPEQQKMTGKEKASPKKKASPHLKSLSKARKISARRGNTTGTSNTRRVSRLVFTKTKKCKSNSRNEKETPTKPAVYRTRNAATMAYEEKLMAVRAASQDPKKNSKTMTKKETAGSSTYEEVIEISKFEPINDSRVLACGLWFKVGDIISVHGDEKAGNREYYARILLFLRDRHGEHYCSVRWLVPVHPKKQLSIPFSFTRFDFDNYLEGPPHSEPIKMASVNFVSHSPTGAGVIIPGVIDRLEPNPYNFLYRQQRDVKILDCPSRTATTIDPKLRNPYL